MKESNLNTIIQKTLNRKNWGFKIPDPMHGTGIQNPFDLVGAYHGKPLYIESKLIKTEHLAFNFNKIEDHQIRNLRYLAESLKESICLVAVGYYVPRKLFNVFFFDIKTILNLKSQGVNSLKKKSITQLYQDGLYLPIEYEKIEVGGSVKRVQYLQNFEQLEEKVITDEMCNM